MSNANRSPQRGVLVRACTHSGVTCPHPHMHVASVQRQLRSHHNTARLCTRPINTCRCASSVCSLSVVAGNDTHPLQRARLAMSLTGGAVTSPNREGIHALGKGCVSWTGADVTNPVVLGKVRLRNATDRWCARGTKTPSDEEPRRKDGQRWTHRLTQPRPTRGCIVPRPVVLHLKRHVPSGNRPCLCVSEASERDAIQSQVHPSSGRCLTVPSHADRPDFHASRALVAAGGRGCDGCRRSGARDDVDVGHVQGIQDRAQDFARRSPAPHSAPVFDAGGGTPASPTRTV